MPYLKTYRCPSIGFGDQLFGEIGSFRPFAHTREERIASGDSRLSIEERYVDREAYLSRVAMVAKRMIGDRLLLPRIVGCSRPGGGTIRLEAVHNDAARRRIRVLAVGGRLPHREALPFQRCFNLAEEAGFDDLPLAVVASPVPCVQTPFRFQCSNTANSSNYPVKYST